MHRVHIYIWLGLVYVLYLYVRVIVIRDRPPGGYAPSLIKYDYIGTVVKPDAGPSARLGIPIPAFYVLSYPAGYIAADRHDCTPCVRIRIITGYNSQRATRPIICVSLLLILLLLLFFIIFLLFDARGRTR